ncbi:hypothetical protein [Methylobacterium pseudosasicola]|uniref:Uncharacterized protein n=1 Tax=Methylobacterium pseudosasicola TaxID=582667 RepID=A0A1I4GAT0_9HYPH|nr:hypothetical protein [Methylobacterium pseudosasicola]SFL26407.1 hypothetical protein SAMN05192568_1002269 [Methylobacterium pseudosasicola]
MTCATTQPVTPSVRRRPETDRSAAMLERIADTLRLPVDAFFPDKPEPGETVAQAADLVTAFMAIETVAARRTCLAYVRAMARP